jgi:hypothetical protein
MAKKRNRSKVASTSNRTVDRLGNTEIGISNMSRSFAVASNNNGPQIMLRKAQHCFPLAWSNAEDPWDPAGSSGASTDVTTADPTTILYPQNPLADGFLNEYWPSLNSLLSSGLGSRFTPTKYEIVRYFAMSCKLLELIVPVLQANHLAYKMDWSVIAPYTSSVPNSAYGIASSYDATNVGMNDRWRPYIDRIAEHVLPPIISAEIMINAFPMVGTPFGHQLVVSSYDPTDAYSDDPDAVEIQISALLDYLDVELVQTANLLRTFTPWRIGVPRMATKLYNSMYATALYNSGFTAKSGFGAVLPENTHVITVGSAATNGDEMIFYHLGARPTISEIINTTVIENVDDATDYYRLLSNWNRNTGVLIDDNGVDIILYSDNESSGATAIRYANYVSNRFRVDEPFAGGDPGPAQGRGQVPYMASNLSTDMVYRTNRDYFLHTMGIDNIREIALHAGGASMRTLRDTLRPLWLPRW